MPRGVYDRSKARRQAQGFEQPAKECPIKPAHLNLCKHVLRAAVLGLRHGNPDKREEYLSLIDEVADDLESLASVL